MYGSGKPIKHYVVGGQLTDEDVIHDEHQQGEGRCGDAPNTSYTWYDMTSLMQRTSYKVRNLITIIITTIINQSITIVLDHSYCFYHGMLHKINPSKDDAGDPTLVTSASAATTPSADMLDCE